MSGTQGISVKYSAQTLVEVEPGIYQQASLYINPGSTQQQTLVPTQR